MKKLLVLSAMLACLTYTVSLSAGSGDKKEPSTPHISISGTITDLHTGEALAGVSVSLKEIDQNVYSDFDGGFKFTGLAPGEYTLKTTYISYQESSSKIKVKSNDKKEVLVKLTNMIY
jgi:hypothetical protein